MLIGLFDIDKVKTVGLTKQLNVLKVVCTDQFSQEHKCFLFSGVVERVKD